MYLLSLSALELIPTALVIVAVARMALSRHAAPLLSAAVSPAAALMLADARLEVALSAYVAHLIAAQRFEAWLGASSVRRSRQALAALHASIAADSFTLGLWLLVTAPSIDDVPAPASYLIAIGAAAVIAVNVLRREHPAVAAALRGHPHARAAVAGAAALPPALHTLWGSDWLAAEYRRVRRWLAASALTLGRTAYIVTWRADLRGEAYAVTVEDGVVAEIEAHRFPRMLVAGSASRAEIRAALGRRWDERRVAGAAWLAHSHGVCAFGRRVKGGVRRSEDLSLVAARLFGGGSPVDVRGVLIEDPDDQSRSVFRVDHVGVAPPRMT